MFGFNIRSPERDRETDRARLKRILTTLLAVKDELQMEKYGLNQRFTETSADAALTLDAMAGVIHPGSYEDRLENLTSVIKAYEKRITFLDSQLDFVEAVLVRVSSYHSDL